MVGEHPMAAYEEAWRLYRSSRGRARSPEWSVIVPFLKRDLRDAHARLDALNAATDDVARRGAQALRDHEGSLPLVRLAARLHDLEQENARLRALQRETEVS